MRNDTAGVLGHSATAADFGSPPVRTAYGRFLGLLVIAGIKDRFTALDVLRAKGVEAAVEFLGQCNLSSETYETDDAPKPRFGDTPDDEAMLGVERCRALGRAIQHESDDGDEHAALYTPLDRELVAVDKILETNKQWGGYGRRVQS